MAHFDDESLFQYVEGTSPNASEIESHVSSCAECAGEVGEQRELMGILGEKDVWNPTSAPRQFVLDVAAFAERARAEDHDAVHICNEILTGPSSWWPQRLRTAKGAYTAGMRSTSANTRVTT
jgi:hypothetical protein